MILLRGRGTNGLVMSRVVLGGGGVHPPPSGSVCCLAREEEVTQSSPPGPRCCCPLRKHPKSVRIRPASYIDPLGRRNSPNWGDPIPTEYVVIAPEEDWGLFAFGYIPVRITAKSSQESWDAI